MNYLEALKYGNLLLKSNNIKSYSLDAELLLSKVLRSTRENLILNLSNKIDKKYFNQFQKLILRRKNNEPIAYIFKNKEFWKYKFYVDKKVLIPRPETEIIVSEILKLTNKNSSKHILDIGTGSGCILISIMKERPNCYGTAIDISKKALKVALINAKMHQLKNKIKLINIDIDKYEYNKYDLIVSNPPYINSIDLKRLENNVKLYEPHVALNAGIDGLREIRKLILKSNILLKKNGKLVFEIGDKQFFKTMNFLRQNGFYINKICKDTQYIPRVLVSTKLS